jgi:hypothetical protein
MIDYTLILRMKFVGAQWALNGDTYEGLEWLDSSPKPTQAELDALWPQVNYENQCLAVENARLVAYEQQSDPLYFKWQRGDGTEQEWLDAVQAVKDANPYPPKP